MKKLLITGVAGFIGAHVAKRFLELGLSVIGVDDLSQGYERNIPRGIEFIRGDLSLKTVVAKLPVCDAVLHLAGQSSGEISFDDPVADLHKNTISTLNLIEWALNKKAQRFLYASSMSAYGTQPDVPTPETAPCVPLSCYGNGKYSSEQYLRIYSKKLPAVSLRMFNVYGPGQDLSNMRQGMVSIFVQQALQGGKIHVKGSLERYRDIINIDDVVETWVRCLNMPLAGHVPLNVGTGIKTTIAMLLEAIAKHVPGTTWYSEGGTPGDQYGIYADTTRLRELTGLMQFTLLENGLSKFIAWARNAQGRSIL